MSKSIQVRDPEVIRAVKDGAEYLIIDHRRFLLVEVDTATDKPYHVSDPEEAAVVREALQDTSPRLSGKAAREYLKARTREHGVR